MALQVMVKQPRTAGNLRSQKQCKRMRWRTQPLNSSTSTRTGMPATSVSLSQLVSESLAAGGGHPFLGVKSLLEEDIAFDGPLVQLRSADAYLQNATFWWEKQQSWLPESECKVLRVSQVSPDQVLVRWRLTWIRPASYNLVKLGRALPGVEVRFKDLLDKYDQEVKVTWKALGRLLQRLVKDRVLEVSIAAIEGTTTFKFRDRDPAPGGTTAGRPGSAALGTGQPAGAGSGATGVGAVGSSTGSTANSTIGGSEGITSTEGTSSKGTSSKGTVDSIGGSDLVAGEAVPGDSNAAAPPARSLLTVNGPAGAAPSGSSHTPPGVPCSTSDAASPASTTSTPLPTSMQPPESQQTSLQSQQASTELKPSSPSGSPSLPSGSTSTPAASVVSPSPVPPPPVPRRLLSQSTEFVDLLPLLLSKKVKNRLVAKDLLLLLYIRQPLGWTFENWFAHVGEQVDVTDVPGIGGFELDGLSTEERAANYEDATFVLALATFAVLVVAFGFSWKYMSKWTM